MTMLHGDLTNCPLCKSMHAKRLYGMLLECNTCHLVRTDPKYLEERVVTRYDESYFTKRNAYLDREDEFLHGFEVLVNQFEPFAKPGGKLLDVGCGAGLLMKVAQKHGFDASGCDIAEWARQHAREHGFEVQVGPLENLSYTAGAFDVIVCNHTLEHIPEPLPFLREIKRLLNAGGILVIGVPNFDSLVAKIMQGRWGSLLPEQHLWHFTPQTLRKMITCCGFKPIYLGSELVPTNHPQTLKRITLKLIRKAGHLVHRDESITLIAQSPAQNISAST